MLTRRILQFTTALAAGKLSSAQTAPSAIAQLKSRRAEAHPFPNEERQARIERAQRLMQRRPSRPEAAHSAPMLCGLGKIMDGRASSFARRLGRRRSSGPAEIAHHSKR
jgi:hypothetical protein